MHSVRCYPNFYTTSVGSLARSWFLLFNCFTTKLIPTWKHPLYYSSDTIWKYCILFSLCNDKNDTTLNKIETSVLTSLSTNLWHLAVSGNTSQIPTDQDWLHPPHRINWFSLSTRIIDYMKTGNEVDIVYVGYFKTVHICYWLFGELIC